MDVSIKKFLQVIGCFAGGLNSREYYTLKMVQTILSRCDRELLSMMEIVV